MNKSPIGVFDSGLGGLSTVRALKRILPNEAIREEYLTAHAPTKQSKRTLLRILNFLKLLNVK